MATGTNSANQDMKFLVEEITVNGTAVLPVTVAELGGTLTGTVTGSMADVADIALSTSNTYTDAAVNAAVNAAIAEVNLQLKELQTQLNALIAALD